MIRVGVGQTLRERWHIDALLGQGGLGTVWAATHRNGDRVAIKVLRPELVNDGGICERFLREAKIANRVKHPAVVRIIDDDVLPDGTPILVMDLLDGESIEKRRERLGGKLPASEALAHVMRLLEVLEVAHAAGVIHRDIKPDNLFVERDGTLRVLDFGIARIVDDADSSTRTGALLGTLGFMPPEQAGGRNKEIDARSDIFAVGATAFALLAGEPIHDTTSVAELMVAALTRPARSLAAVAPGLDPGLVRVIDRALKSDARERWQTARAMSDALAPYAPARATPRIMELAQELSGVGPTTDTATAEAPTARFEDAVTNKLDARTLVKEQPASALAATPATIVSAGSGPLLIDAVPPSSTPTDPYARTEMAFEPESAPPLPPIPPPPPKKARPALLDALPPAKPAPREMNATVVGPLQLPAKPPKPTASARNGDKLTLIIGIVLAVIALAVALVVLRRLG